MGLWAHGGVGIDDFGSVRLKLVPFNAEVISEQISFGCLEFVFRKFWEILEKHLNSLFKKASWSFSD